MIHKDEPSSMVEEELKFSLPRLPQECAKLPSYEITQHYLDLNSYTLYVEIPKANDSFGRIVITGDSIAPLILPFPATQWISFINQLERVEGQPLLVMPCDPKNFSARLRVSTKGGVDKFTLTIKRTIPNATKGVDARVELNVNIDPSFTWFVARWQMLNSHLKVSKQRYHFSSPSQPGVWEIDAFTHPNKAFIAEYELEPDSEEKHIPTPPDEWEAVNVAGVASFLNSEIASNQKIPEHPK